MSNELRIAMGPRGFTLTVPPSVEVTQPRPVLEDSAAKPASPSAQLRHALQAPLSGPTLKEVAAGKRRATILIGDLSLPALYEELLPELCRALLECEIRPSRIAFLCCPGASGPVLGRFAIRRYGQETVADHELRGWEGPGADLDALYRDADLRLAVFPALAEATAALPPDAPPHLAVAIFPGSGLVQKIEAVRAGAPKALFPQRNATAQKESKFAVFLTTGGGAPTDVTLEEALLSFRYLPSAIKAKKSEPSATGEGDATLVLAFDGEEGLGSAHFTLDFWALLRQAEELLSAQGQLPCSENQQQTAPWDPAGAIAEALGRWKHILLFSPGLSAHEEGDELREHLTECPTLSKRLIFVDSERNLWSSLEAMNGANYLLQAEPLGWRAWTSPLENER